LLVSALFSFSEQEIDFIKSKKIIRMCNNPDWTPIEFVSNNNADGIAIDVVRLIAKKISSNIDYNIEIKHIPTKSWKESQAFLRDRKCDILPSAVPTDKRKKYADFTDAYLDYALVIITRVDAPFNVMLDDIKNKIIARKEGSGLIRKLKKIYPKINILETKTYKDSFDAVSKGKA